MLAVLGNFIAQQIAEHGLAAVFVLMLLGSACVPIPSELVMAFGGALASGTFSERVLGGSSGQPGLVAVIVVGVVASMLGSWLAWWVGVAGGRPLIDRFGRYVLLRPHEVDRAHAWFERHGEATVFFGRLIPLIRAFISLPAGVARMRFDRFTIFTFLGIVPWTVGFALAGYALGEQWGTIERYIAPISITVGLLLIGAGIWWIRRRLGARTQAPGEDAVSR